MPGMTWTFDPDEVEKWGEIPACVFKTDSNATGFGASGALNSGTGVADFAITTGYIGGTKFHNTVDADTTHWFSSELSDKMTDQDASGFFTNILKMTNKSSGSSQSVSYRKPKYEASQQNGFGHVKIASGDYFELDDTISLQSNDEWTLVIVTGVTTPSLYGCYLGSLNANGSTILSSYRWAGRTLKLKNDSGDEVDETYDSTFESGSGGGAESIHVISCDGNNDVYLRLNGSDLGDDTVTANSTFNFGRVGHLQTRTTQQNSTFSIHELIVFNKQLTGDDLTGLEGDLAGKYAITDRLESNHPHYNATASSIYNSPISAPSNSMFTTGTLSLSTTESDFSTKSTSITGGAYYTIYPTNIGTPGTVTVKVTWA